MVKIKIFYKGHTIEAMRDGEGAFYVVDGKFSCLFMNEALEFIEILIKEAKSENNYR